MSDSAPFDLRDRVAAPVVRAAAASTILPASARHKQRPQLVGTDRRPSDPGRPAPGLPPRGV